MPNRIKQIQPFLGFANFYQCFILNYFAIVILFTPSPVLYSTTHLHTPCVLHRKFKNGTFEKNKAYLVACGNHQRPRIDYDESFSPVMRLELLPTLRPHAISTSFRLTPCQYTYMEASRRSCAWISPTDMQQQGRKFGSGGSRRAYGLVQKGLYELVQASRSWNEELDTHMEGRGYTANPAVYIKRSCNQADFAAGRF